MPTNDPLYQSLNVDGKFDEIQRDSMNCAWVTGPGVVFRCSAIRDIGGFPENALAEDILTGFTLQGRGWKVVYCREELQFGLVPDTFKAHVAQRMKWVSDSDRCSDVSRMLTISSSSDGCATPAGSTALYSHRW